MHFGLRSSGSALFVALVVVPGCSLPTAVTGTFDSGVAPVDAFVGGNDVGPGPRDAGVDAFVPGVDAFVPPVDAGMDAFVPGVDAFVPPADAGMDAFVAPDVGTDAFVAPDVGTDAFVAPDAAMPRTCRQIYATTINGYDECATSATSCTFYIVLGGADCDAICTAQSATCISAADNGTDHCSPTGGGLRADQCDNTRTGGICSCTRPF